MLQKNIPFSRQEYNRRLNKTRKAMQNKGIDVLFTQDPSNMAWLTGYDGWSFYVHQGVIVFLDEDPIWWGRNMDGNGALRTIWMADNRIEIYNDTYVQSSQKHPMTTLAALLESKGYGNQRIGLELDNYYFSAKAYLVLQSALCNARFVDATALVNWQRGIKSQEEIAFMRKAALISEKIIDGIVERTEVGLAKNELVGTILKDAVCGTKEAWGDYAAIVPLLPSGSDAAAPHLTWNGEPLAKGEATFFEISGCYRRYHAPCCRTVFLGKPPHFMREAERALVEGLEAGLETARAGNRACDIAEALAKPLEAAGIERSARCGYGIGLSYPPDWGERNVSLRETDETILQPGMTFHFMPGLWMQNWGIEITESILIKDKGPAETLCNRPRQIFVKD